MGRRIKVNAYKLPGQPVGLVYWNTTKVSQALTNVMTHDLSADKGTKLYHGIAPLSAHTKSGEDASTYQSVHGAVTREALAPHTAHMLAFDRAVRKLYVKARIEHGDTAYTRGDAAATVWHQTRNGRKRWNIPRSYVNRVYSANV